MKFASERNVIGLINQSEIPEIGLASRFAYVQYSRSGMLKSDQTTEKE